ncbi:MAG TPA: agmatinase [Bacteroidota bacterium]|nr:agmatinase [Bacteroidota bacterium]
MKELGIDHNFLGIEDQHSRLDSSAIAILQAPYEATVSYGKGTAQGPSALIEASHYVEFWDEMYQRELCFEKGIATLEALDFGAATGRAMLDQLQEAVKTLLDMDKFVVTLGGEHSISTAPIAAHLERYPGMSVLQIDAHSDLRESYEGTPYSHASIMARVLEFMDPARIVQVGIRAQCREEFETIRERGINTFFAWQIRQGVFGQSWKERVLDALGDEVYITFDVDGLDPSVLGATGTPEPGGLLWDETMQLLAMIGKRKRIVGFDVVELAPDEVNPYSAFVAAKLTYKLLNAAFSGTR